jgi:hypothetical protein
MSLVSDTTHFTCEDCGATVKAVYETATCVCLSCQFRRNHPFPDEEQPCPVCGNEERGQGGYLSCECPAPALSSHHQGAGN